MLLQISILIVSVIFFQMFQWYSHKIKLEKYAKQVPGPPTIPFLGNAHLFFGKIETTFATIMSIYSKYPDIARVWIGSKLIFFVSHPSHAEYVLAKEYRREMHMLKYSKPLIGRGLFTSPVTKWKRDRKLLTPSFNKKILESYVNVFFERSKLLVNDLNKQVGNKDLDILKFLSKATLDFICDTFLGHKLNENYQYAVAKWVEDFARVVTYRMTVWPLQFDFIFKLTHMHTTFETSVKNLQHFCDEIIKQKLEQDRYEAEIYNENPKKGFLDLLLEIQNHGHKFEENELREHIITMIIAGTDTVAVSTSFLMTALGILPDIQRKVYEEILDVVGPDGPITEAHLPHLKYLERVCKESLRLFPPAPLLGRYLENEVKLSNGVIFPKESSVYIGLVPIHRNEKYWPDPLKFDPDRFLPENVAKQVSGTYLAFSSGPRNCIGGVYAMMAMKTMAASLVRSYRIKSGFKQIEDVHFTGTFVSRPIGGYKVSLELRK